jgi:hypothetical protein
VHLQFGLELRCQLCPERVLLLDRDQLIGGEALD